MPVTEDMAVDHTNALGDHYWHMGAQTRLAYETFRSQLSLRDLGAAILQLVTRKGSPTYQNFDHDTIPT
jgi:hypothetical protein